MTWSICSSVGDGSSRYNRWSNCRRRGAAVGAIPELSTYYPVSDPFRLQLESLAAGEVFPQVRRATLGLLSGSISAKARLATATCALALLDYEQRERIDAAGKLVQTFSRVGMES